MSADTTASEPDISSPTSEALAVMREIWRGTGQSSADLADSCGEKTCRKMDDAGVGFGGFADDGDLQGAWRARLEREGKLSQVGGSIRDLVLGPAAPAADAR